MTSPTKNIFVRISTSPLHEPLAEERIAALFLLATFDHVLHLHFVGEGLLWLNPQLHSKAGKMFASYDLYDFPTFKLITDDPVSQKLLPHLPAHTHPCIAWHDIDWSAYHACFMW